MDCKIARLSLSRANGLQNCTSILNSSKRIATSHVYPYVEQMDCNIARQSKVCKLTTSTYTSTSTSTIHPSTHPSHTHTHTHLSTTCMGLNTSTQCPSPSVRQFYNCCSMDCVMHCALVLRSSRAVVAEETAF